MFQIPIFTIFSHEKKIVEIINEIQRKKSGHGSSAWHGAKMREKRRSRARGRGRWNVPCNSAITADRGILFSNGGSSAAWRAINFSLAVDYEGRTLLFIFPRQGPLVLERYKEGMENGTVSWMRTSSYVLLPSLLAEFKGLLNGPILNSEAHGFRLINSNNNNCEK